jgi:putative PIN family toxin of toxin-antitoxin system
MRVVADTNVLVSARIVAHGKPAAIFRQIGLFEHVTSPEILQETEQVLNRKHILQRYRLSSADIEQYIGFLCAVSTVVENVPTIDPVSADPDDDKFLALGHHVSADYIISGDPHLTSLNEYAGIAIVTPARFLAILPGHPSQVTT